MQSNVGNSNSSPAQSYRNSRRNARGNFGDKQAQQLPHRTARKKADKHNNLIERMYKGEENINLLDEKIKVANHRIDDLEEK